MATISASDVSERHTKTSESVGHDGRQDGANYELHRAVFHDDLAKVEELLATKLDPSAQDKHGGWLTMLEWRRRGVCVDVTVCIVQLTLVFI